MNHMITFWDLIVSTTIITEGNSSWNLKQKKVWDQHVDFQLLSILFYLIKLVIHMRYCQMWISKELKHTQAFS